MFLNVLEGQGTVDILEEIKIRNLRSFFYFTELRDGRFLHFAA